MNNGKIDFAACQVHNKILVAGQEIEMTVLLEIASELESQVRATAQKEGVAPEVYIANLLQQHFSQHQQLWRNLPQDEAVLLEQINLGLPQETWQRYYKLIEKRRAETLAPDEHLELIGISDRLEEANARRIMALIQLAEIRHTTLDKLMDQLGLRPPTYV